MSFLSKIFGGSRAEKAAVPEAAIAEADYKGFTIRAVPRRDGGQFQIAGTIEKTIGDVVRRIEFVRADKSPNKDEIADMTLMKGRLMIDQQGDTLLG